MDLALVNHHAGIRIEQDFILSLPPFLPCTCPRSLTLSLLVLILALPPLRLSLPFLPTTIFLRPLAAAGGHQCGIGVLSWLPVCHRLNILMHDFGQEKIFGWGQPGAP